MSHSSIHVEPAGQELVSPGTVQAQVNVLLPNKGKNNHRNPQHSLCMAKLVTKSTILAIFNGHCSGSKSVFIVVQ